MRKEIDRILGNSLRCILPSYWWKRLLGKMADKIESAEESAASASRIAMLAGFEASDKQDRLVSGSNIKTINNQSILGSGNITVSTERMEKYKTKEELDAVGSTDGGEIAAVVDDVLVEKSFTECYQPTRSEIEANPYNKKFTKVDGISLNPDFNPNLMSSNYGSLSVILHSDGNSKGYYKEYPSYLEIRCDYNRRIICWEHDSISGSGHTLYDSSGFNASNIDRVNNILREGDFRFSYFEVTYRKNVSDTGYTYYYSYQSNFPSDATAMIDNVVKMLFAETQNADIYVRSKEWVRLLKEGDVTGGGADITNDVIISRAVYPTKTVLFGIEIDHEISETEREYNCETFRMAANNVVMLKGDTNSVAPLLELTEESATFGAFKYQAIIGPEKMLTFVSCLIDKDGNVIEEIEIAESEFLIRTINEKTEIREVYIGDSLTDEQKAWNLETLELAKQGKAIVRATLHGNTFILELFNEDNEYQFGYTQFSPSGGVAVSVGVAEDGLAGIKIEYSHFDSELSDTSENAVQNKVIKAYVDEKVANIVASSFVIDLTVDEIEDAISNNGGVIDYTLNRELIIDALSKNIPMVVRIGEHSNGYCLAQGELDGADTLTITFNYSQYKYSILIGDESIEVDRSSSISALEARLAALEAKLS